MNSTSAEDVIIQALWPGPALVVMALGAPLLMYASRSATRVARSGPAGAAAAGAAGCCARAAPPPSDAIATSASANRIETDTDRDFGRLIVRSWAPGWWGDAPAGDARGTRRGL